MIKHQQTYRSNSCKTIELQFEKTSSSISEGIKCLETKRILFLHQGNLLGNQILKVLQMFDETINYKINELMQLHYSSIYSNELEKNIEKITKIQFDSAIAKEFVNQSIYFLDDSLLSRANYIPKTASSIEDYDPRLFNSINMLNKAEDLTNFGKAMPRLPDPTINFNCNNNLPCPSIPYNHGLIDTKTDVLNATKNTAISNNPKPIANNNKFELPNPLKMQPQDIGT